ncbi:MAG: DMT family transporter [Anaerostipes sp.]|jgi:drug/metabolite transporter (DMT)-like permease|nr:DMT family transporter [Anaerostipes sp.]MDD3746092.1 DMT family transporter [Anaerostipes sp.]
MTQKQKGVFFIIVSAFCFAWMNAFVKLSGDLPSIEKSFFRNLVALIFAFILICKSGDGFHFKKENLSWFILRSAAGTLGIFCNFYAVDHLVLSDASTLNKLSPFFVIVFSFLLLKERIKIPQAVCLIAAFIGSMFIVKPSFANASFMPALIGFMGGLFAGAAYTCVRKLGLNGEKGTFIVFFFSTFSCISCIPFIIADFHPISLSQLGFLIMAGLAASGGQFAITKAYTCAPGREVSIYDYTQIIFTTVIGFFLFGQVPDGLSFVGYIVIVVAAVSMFLYNNGQGEKTD